MRDLRESASRILDEYFANESFAPSPPAPPLGSIVAPPRRPKNGTAPGPSGPPKDGIGPVGRMTARAAGSAVASAAQGTKNVLSGKPSGFGVAITTPTKGGSVTRSAGNYDDDTASKTRLGVQVTRPVRGGSVTHSVGTSMNHKDTIGK